MYQKLGCRSQTKNNRILHSCPMKTHLDIPDVGIDVIVRTIIYVTWLCHKNDSTLEKELNNQLIHDSSQLHLSVLNGSQADVCSNSPRDTTLAKQCARGNNPTQLSELHHGRLCGVSVTTLTMWTSHWTVGCLCHIQLPSDNMFDRRHLVTETPVTRPFTFILRLACVVVSV